MKKINKITLAFFASSAAVALYGQDQTIVHDDGSIGIVVRGSNGGGQYIHLDNPPPQQPQQQGGQNGQRRGPGGPGGPGGQGGPGGGAQQAVGSAQAGAPAQVAENAEGGDEGIGSGRRMPENRNAMRVSPNRELQGPFFFVDEAPAQVIQTLEALLGKSILQAQALPQAKINFVSRKQMTREEAIGALKSLLALNGIAIAPLDDSFFRAIPTIGVGRQSPEFIQGDASALPPSQVFHTKLFELEYIEVSSVQGKIRNMMSVDGTGLVESFPRSNALLVTDALINIQNIEKLLKKLDVPASMNEEIVFIQIENVGAAEVRERLNTLQSEILKKYFDKTTIDVDARTNQLIVVTQKGNIEHIKKLIAGLDIKSEPLLKNEVILIRHCKASEIETVLKSIITQQQQQLQRAARERRETASAAARDAAVRANAIRNTGNQNLETAARIASAPAAGMADGASSGLEFSEYVQVVSHETSSSIVVYGTESDIRQLRDIVKRLDVAIDQVRIDVIITEVNLTDGQVSGLSSFGLSYNMPGTTNGMGIDSGFALTTGSDSVDETAPQAFQFGINENAFIASFNIARQNQNVKVLSSPTIVTTHGRQAQINIVEKHPTVESSNIDSSNPSASRSNYTTKDVGIQLLVTPFIGTDGVIFMEIKQNVDSVARYVVLDNNRQPVISERSAQSYVSVKDKQVVVLAGLQQTDVSDTEGSVWLLGDIPILGEMFKPAHSSAKRRELIMFIRPRIIKSSSVEDVLTGETLKDSFVEREVKNFLGTGRFYDEAEMRTNIREFEDNRLYNKALKDPEAFLTGEPLVREGSTRAHDSKIKSAIEAAENAPLAKDAEKTRAQESEKSESGESDDVAETANKARKSFRRK